MRRLLPFCRLIALAAAMGLPIRPVPAIAGAAKAGLGSVRWGETSQQLEHQFGMTAMPLPRPLDFGDSYSDVVLKGDRLGGVPVAVFFQMDKATHGLRRVQLEPLGHALNPRAFGAIVAALDAEYGRPDQICETPPVPAAGFQWSVEEKWRRNDAMISAIFRDTTLQAFEGCRFGPANGWCGLHGQILVRLAPPAAIAAACVPPARPG
ncbi:MAG TPA: hypothetical protein VL985_15260 [Stellaceae bacterium]|nr:hypothetical protein [Stellaceae bacterium]